MSRFLQLILTGCLALFLTLSGGSQTASAQRRHHHHHKATEVTEWTAISEAPGVHHTVMGGHDVFRHHDLYYRYDGGRWHRGRHQAGPWVPIAAPPPVIHRVDRGYFRNVPPGWRQGRKTGWHGAMPPGQMKKFH
jgi:hypothetical protein